MEKHTLEHITKILAMYTAPGLKHRINKIKMKEQAKANRYKAFRFINPYSRTDVNVIKLRDVHINTMVMR